MLSLPAFQTAEKDAIQELRRRIPVDGEEWTYLWQLCLMPGSGVDSHTHHHWVAVTHVPPSDGDPPVMLRVGDKWLLPDPWEIILIPPGTDHEVPPWNGKKSRLSFALAVEPGDNRQTIKHIVR